MRKVAISLGFAAIFVGLGRFLFVPAFLAERADGATSILLARASSPSPRSCANENDGGSSAYFSYGARQTS